MKSVRIISALLAVFTLLLLPGARTGDGASPVRLGMALSLSGEAARMGSSSEKGVRLWVDEVNARGGILGRQVELKAVDDHSDPARTVEAYRQLASGGADLLIGPPDSSASLDVLPVLKQAGMPCVFPMAVSDTLWEDARGLAFGVFSPAADWPAGFFEILSRSGASSVAILAVDHPNPSRILSIAEKWARRYGVEPTLQLALAAAELPAAIERLKAAKADAVAVWGCERASVAAVKALGKAGWLQGRSAYVSSSLASGALLTLPAREVEGVFTALPWDIRASQAFPDGPRFVRAFRAAHGQDPDYMAAASYAACQVIEAAVARARALDKESLRQALSGLETLTVMGRYGVAPSGMQLRQMPLTLQWQKGKREVVWPETMRTALPAVAR